jgi:broad specificity phosphatase PhoE
VGNVNKEIYKEIPDYAIQLTEVGRKQASATGKELSELMRFEKVKFYISTFWRTRQTAEEIMNWFEPHQIIKPYYDPRLREQEWGHLNGKSFQMEYEKERDEYGHFYWRFPNGESCADVYDRVSDFLNTLYRDFEKEDFPENVVIVTHGMAMRLLLMRWFHYSVEEFEQIGNPKNASWYLLEKGNDDKFQLKSELRYHELKHNFQYPQYTPLPKI